MCNLVPMKLCGQTVNIAEHKVEKIKKYLEVFPKLKSVDKVYLFGSTLETRCTENSDIDLLFVYNDRKLFHHEMSWDMLDIFQESAEDVALRIPENYDIKCAMGAVKTALTKGKVIYERS